MQRLAREYTPKATKVLIDIVDDPKEDSRNRIVAAGMLFDRAWGKVKEMPERDPKAELQEMTDEELSEHTARLLASGGMSERAALAYVRRALKLDRERGE
jgi:hypothetical protein